MRHQVQKKAQKKYKKLKFEEGPHIYKVDKKKIPSTSSLINKFYKKFDAQGVSFSVAKRRKMSQAQVLKEWKDINTEAINRGSRVHNFAEDYSNGLPVVASCIQEEAVVKFWEELPSYYQCVFVELKMYSAEYWYAGTTDFVLLDTRDNSLVIGDYKTNGNIFKTYGYMLPPFDLLEDNPYNHYQIQFSYYQILLEQLGYKISNRMLVWLKHEGGYEIYNTSNFSNVLKKTFDDKWRNNTESTEPLF